MLEQHGQLWSDLIRRAIMTDPASGNATERISVSRQRRGDLVLSYVWTQRGVQTEIEGVPAARLMDLFVRNWWAKH
jgi:hypothetical protein